MNDQASHARLLLVEDNRDLAETTGLFLEGAGFELDYAADGLTALHLGTVNSYDAIILDLGLPGLDGIEVCQRLRRDAGLSAPVLMLTARDQLDDKLEGFHHGADDYLVKPFALPELVVRLRALIRRDRGTIQQKSLVVGDLLLDLRKQEARREGKLLRLTPTGLKILRILMRQSPNLVRREDLERELWGDEVPDSDTLRSHLYQLRRSLDKPFATPMLETVQGLGLRLVSGP